MLNQILSYILLGFLLLAAVMALYLPFYFIFRKRIPFIRQICVVLLIGSVLVVLCATLLLSIFAIVDMGYPLFQRVHLINWIPLSWLVKPWTMGREKMLAQIVANILMLVPLGFLLPIVFAQLRRFWKTVLCVFLLMLTIEFFQYWIGSSADIDDLIQNTLGAMIGYGLFALFSQQLGCKAWWHKALNHPCSHRCSAQINAVRSCLKKEKLTVMHGYFCQFKQRIRRFAGSNAINSERRAGKNLLGMLLMNLKHASIY
ncbi:MAG: VanZ family protein [Clostridia bacterium]